MAQTGLGSAAATPFGVGGDSPSSNKRPSEERPFCITVGRVPTYPCACWITVLAHASSERLPANEQPECLGSKLAQGKRI
eukprot:2254461-Amphidinium_carterae.1